MQSRFWRATIGALVLSGVIAGASLMPGCATAPAGTSQTTTNIAQAITDAKAVVAGVQQSYATLKTLYPLAITPATDAQVTALLDSAPGILAGLSAAADPATNAGGLRGVESIVNQVLNIVAASTNSIPGIPPEVLLGLQAATVLLPLIEAAANGLVPQAATVAAGPAKFRSAMTPAQARAQLGER